MLGKILKGWVLALAICLLIGGRVQAEADPAPAAAPADLLDGMDEGSAWKVYSDDRGVKVDVLPVDVEAGKALEIGFTMGPGEWLGIFRSIDRDLSGYKAIRFRYRGEGSPNSLEIKLEDADGSQFGRVLKTKTNLGSWTTVVIPFSELSYWWGGDNKLAWDKVHNCHFAISMKDSGDKGGAGKVIVDEIELLK
jgi:hypothetical protein